MAGSFLKWLIPGLVAVAGGAALAISLGSASMSSDLEARAISALEEPDSSWASVHIDGRDAILTGTATTQEMIDAASGRLASLHGVRSVESAVTLAEFVSPFPFEAVKEDGIVTLNGGFPDEQSHKTILEAAPEAVDDTRLLSGSPDRAKFAAATTFALQSLAEMDEGKVALADLSLSITGRAASADGYGRLAGIRARVPAGITLAKFDVALALASPYRWEAKFDGTSMTVSGSSPNPDLADRLRAAVAPLAVSTTLTLASGEPQGFAANTLILLKSLVGLEDGTASIEDDEITLSGSPRTAEAADAVTAAVTAIGGEVTLDAPRVAEYVFSATKDKDGIGLLGFVPDTQTRDRVLALEHADASKLRLARGAPERFASALDFGLAALERMSEGEFALSGTRLTITGRAATLDDFNALSATIAEGAPQGLVLETAEISPPLANPFTFTATRDATGRTSLAGYVPSEADRSAIRNGITGLAADNAVLADGAPPNFAASVHNGLTVLALFDSGTLLYDGKSWSLKGMVDSAQKGFAADAAYSIAGLRTAGWTYEVQLPPEPTLPIIAPYVWGAQKATGGTMRFTGFAPNQAFKDELTKRGGTSSDSTLLGAGAPDEFASNASAGLDALAKLDEGSLGLSGRNWVLTGRAVRATDRTEIQDTLASRIDPSLWRIAIQTPDAAPIVTPYLWSAEKREDGSVELAGYVPTDGMLKLVERRAGTVTRNTIGLASGEPSGFSDDVLAGLDALTHLATGTASFDGSKWTLVGRAASSADGERALASLLGGSQAGAHWDRAIDGLAPPAAPSSAPPPSSEVPDTSSSEPAPADIASQASSVEPPASSSDLSSIAVATAPEPSSAPVVDPLPAMPADLAFEASRTRGGPVALAGSVSTEEIKSYLSVIAGKAPIDAISVDPALPSTFIPNAKAAIDAVNKLTEARAGFDGRRWWLSGKAADPAVRDAVLAAISALPTSVDWSTNIALVPTLDLCRDTVGALAARNAIIFNSGSATLSDESSAPLDELAGDLSICPNATVHVEGHTDADGAEDINLALSVERAEAVVEALIDRGVAVERLYAEGYGETMPIASNDSRQGKQANRRIAFTLTEGD